MLKKLSDKYTVAHIGTFTQAGKVNEPNSIFEKFKDLDSGIDFKFDQ